MRRPMEGNYLLSSKALEEEYKESEEEYEKNKEEQQRWHQETPLLIPQWSPAPQWEPKEVRKGRDKEKAQVIQSSEAENRNTKKPLPLKDLMALLSHIYEQNMKKTVKHSAKGALKVGTAVFLGGLMGGPLGMVVGGTVGLFGAFMTSERFKPLPQIIKEMPLVQQKKLCDHINEVLKTVTWTDVSELIQLVMSNPALQQKLAAVLIKLH